MWLSVRTRETTFAGDNEYILWYDCQQMTIAYVNFTADYSWQTGWVCVMAESDRTVHYDDSVKLIDSHPGDLGHSGPVRGVQIFGSINSSESQHHSFPHLSSSVSSTASSVVPLLHVYRRRWYILFIFTVLSVVQVEMFYFYHFYIYKNWMWTHSLETEVSGLTVWRQRSPVFNKDIPSLFSGAGWV